MDDQKIKEKQQGDKSGISAVPPTVKGLLPAGNGLHLVDKAVDGRSRSAKRWKAVYKALIAQSKVLEKGLAYDQLCRRGASLIVELEKIDALAAKGETVSHNDQTRLIGSLGRIFKALHLVGYSETIWPLIPTEFGHLIRNNLATFAI